MKKNNRPILLISIVFLFLSLFLGCEKEPVDQGYGPIAGQPTIIPSQSLVNGQVIISWTSKDATIVTCNGVAVATTGDLNFPVCDTVLNFVAKNEKFEATKKITVVKPTAPTLTLSYINVATGKTDTLCYLGGQVQIIAIFSGGEFELNGIKYSQSPFKTIALDITTTNNTFEYSVVGVGGRITKSIKIPMKIANPLEVAVSNNGCVWVPYRRDNDLSGIRQKDNNFVSDINRQFLLCPSGKTIMYSDGTSVENTWSLTPDSVFTNNPSMRIEYVSSTELIIKTHGVTTDGSGRYCWIWDYYNPQSQ